MSLQMNFYDGKLFKLYVEILYLLEGMGFMCVCVGGGYSFIIRDLLRMLF